LRAGTPVDDLIGPLELELERQVGAITAALPEEVALQAAASVDPQQRDTVLAELRSLLAGDDARAEKLLAEHAALLAAALPRQFRPLQEAIQRFDYETALDVLGMAEGSIEAEVNR
jgi:hypothetical protein